MRKTAKGKKTAKKIVKNDQWPEWFRCNVLEIVILLLLLVLLIKVFSAPAASAPAVTVVEESLASVPDEANPAEIIVEGAEGTAATRKVAKETAADAAE